jgi:hypothetical protein
MSLRPSKQSNYNTFKITKPESYIRDLNNDVCNLFTHIQLTPKIYQQGTAPTLRTSEWAFWKDTDDSKFYLLINIDGSQKKVELT